MSIDSSVINEQVMNLAHSPLFRILVHHNLTSYHNHAIRNDAGFLPVQNATSAEALSVRDHSDLCHATAPTTRIK